MFSGIKLKTQTKVYKPMNTPNIFYNETRKIYWKNPTESLTNCAAYTGWLHIEEWKYFPLSTLPMWACFFLLYKIETKKKIKKINEKKKLTL